MYLVGRPATFICVWTEHQSNFLAWAAIASLQAEHSIRLMGVCKRFGAMCCYVTPVIKK